MSHLGDNHLLCVAGEHCRGKLDAREKSAFSFKYYLSTCLLVKETLFTRVDDLSVFHAACKFWVKNV